MIADVNLHEAEVSGVADRIRLVAALPLDDGEGDFKRDALPLRLLPDVSLQLVAHGYVVEELRLLFGRNKCGDCAEKRNGRNLHLSFKRIHNQVWRLLRASRPSSVRRG